ncbi:MAG: molybdate ABC transporter substrate-binding protein, partial [Desulfuromonadales bacterium]|nr:molybdate ABC transporter substrate-binding protein [Desulfuromonadales bacterium]NIS40566.1 molybdate ABC transporter substrate-binding protein [Desulfuromonadales bacterium]
IFAASSLRESFVEIGQLYEKQTGQTVRFNFAGSQTLRTQIEFGAPADLYAAANPEIIKPLVNKNLVGQVHFFAGNNLAVLLSKKKSPVKAVADLT